MRVLWIVCCLWLGGSGALAQTPPDLARERMEFQRWLETSEVSPLRAMAQLPATDGMRLGPPDADVPLPNLPEHRISKQGSSFLLESPSGKRRLRHARPVKVGTYTLTLADSEMGSVLTVYGGPSGKKPPGYYPYDSALVFVGNLRPPEKSASIRLLGPDGLVRQGQEAGRLEIPLNGGTELLVRRLPGAREEEWELEIFFSDRTNGSGSYPAGRFVSLVPVGGARYRLDFNRARNPFCAYSTSYACPIPWPGNALPMEVRAGERYTGGGLEISPASTKGK
ncbi:MAG TPA: DUF1684 domain-containing protein [Gemmatimonadales bacterium]|nr:DUF1684 domain-containing protein [Gemmatimonadales bacterium]